MLDKFVTLAQAVVGWAVSNVWMEKIAFRNPEIAAQETSEIKEGFCEEDAWTVS